MISLEDLLILGQLISRKKLAPSRLREFAIVANTHRLSLVQTLLENRVFTEGDWEEAREQVEGKEGWPHHTSTMSHHNRALFDRLSSLDLPSDEIESYRKWMEEKGSSESLWNHLDETGKITDEWREKLEVQEAHLLQCSATQTTFLISPYYPWWDYPSPLADGPLVDVQYTLDYDLDDSMVISDTQFLSPDRVGRRSTQSLRETVADDDSQYEIFQYEPKGQFGRYDLVKRLGEGGMGVVYKAYDPELKRHLAVKIITEKSQFNSEYARRFHREVEVAARLHHPHIVPVYEVGEIDFLPYFTMGYIDGSNLGEMVEENGPFDEGRALEIMEKLCAAVAYAHEQGVIHRDIKPDNVMLDQKGEPYLTDFGLALELKAKDTRLTQTGTIMGSPEFMSPEQARGEKELGFSTDIYALGGVLYFMLAGRPPFSGRDIFELLAKVAASFPRRIKNFNSAVSPAVEGIAHKCLEKEARRRYGTAEEMGRDVHAARQGKAVRARVPGVWRNTWNAVRRYKVALVTAVFLVSLFVGGLYLEQQWKYQKQETQVKALMDRIMKDTAPQDKLEKYSSQIVHQGGSHTVEKLVDYLNSPSPWQRRLAIRSLGQLGDTATQIEGKDAVEWLLDRLKTVSTLPESPLLVDELEEIAQALGLFQDSRSTRHLQSFAMAYLNRGKKKLSHEKLGSALEDMNRAIRVLPDLAVAYQQRGYIRLLQNKLKMAETNIERAMELDDKSGMTYYLRGRIRLAREEFEPALADLLKSLSIEPKLAPAHYYTGQIYDRQNKRDLALQHYSETIKLNPKFDKAYYYRARLWEVREKYDLALADLDRALSLKPDYIKDIYLSKGHLYRYQRKWSQARENFQKMSQIDPKAPRPYRLLARVYLEEKDFKAAAKMATKFIALKPKHPWGYEIRGKSRDHLDDDKGAAEDYDRWIEFAQLGEDKSNAYFHRGILRYNQGKWKDSLSDYQKALAAHPQNHVLYYFLGKVYRRMGKRNAALENLNRAVRKLPDDLRPRFSRGQVLYELGKFDDAKEDFAYLLKKDPKDVKSLEYRARVWRREKKYQKALADVNQAIDLDPNYLHSYTCRGLTYKAMKKLDLAIVDFKKAVQLSPESASLYSNLGIAYRAQKKHKKALEVFDKALELSPETSTYYFNRGITYISLKNYVKAVNDLTKFLECRPKFGAAYLLRGQALVQLGKGNRALADYNQAVKLLPQSAKAHFYRGRLLLMAKELDGALADLTRSIELNPKIPMVHYYRGVAHAKKGLHPQAVADFSRAIQLHRGYASAYYNRAVSYIRMESAGEAAKSFRKFLDLAPNDPRAPQIRSFLKQYDGKKSD